MKEKTTSDELEDAVALKVLYDSEGGKVLVDAFVDDIINRINILSMQYKDLSHMELVSHCAAIGEKLHVVRALVRADEAVTVLRGVLKEEDGDTQT